MPGIPLVPQILRKVLDFHVAKWKCTESSASEGRGELGLLPCQGQSGVSGQLTLSGSAEVVDLGEHVAVKVKRLRLSCSASLLALADACLSAAWAGAAEAGADHRYLSLVVTPRAAVLAWEVSLLLQSPADGSSALLFFLPSAFARLTSFNISPRNKRTEFLLQNIPAPSCQCLLRAVENETKLQILIC